MNTGQPAWCWCWLPLQLGAGVAGEAMPVGAHAVESNIHAEVCTEDSGDSQDQPGSCHGGCWRRPEGY